MSTIVLPEIKFEIQAESLRAWAEPFRDIRVRCCGGDNVLHATQEEWLAVLNGEAAIRTRRDSAGEVERLWWVPFFGVQNPYRYSAEARAEMESRKNIKMAGGTAVIEYLHYHAELSIHNEQYDWDETPSWKRDWPLLFFDRITRDPRFVFCWDCWLFINMTLDAQLLAGLNDACKNPVPYYLV